jgi:primosomal protein DnaI
MKDVKEMTKEMRTGNLSFNDAVLETLHSDSHIAAKIRELGISNQEAKLYFGLLSSYGDDCSYCAKCPGFDKCVKDHPHYQMSIVRNDGLLDRKYGMCSLGLKRELLLSNFIYRDYEDSWLYLDKSGLNNTLRVREVYSAIALAESDPEHPWVYIQGELGAGKSYLLVALANSYVEDGRSVAFINANKRFDELTGYAIKNRPEFDKKMARLESCDLLVVDDFGTEYRKDYMRDQVLLPLLTERAKKHLLTCFASSYSIDEIQTLYSFSASASILAKEIGNLLRSNVKKTVTLKEGIEQLLSKQQ